MVSIIHLFHEVVQGLLRKTKRYVKIKRINYLKDSPQKITRYGCLLSFLQGQCFPNVGNVIKRLQLRHARAQHHGEQIDEEISMLPDRQVRFITHLLESGGRGKQV